MTSKVTIGTHNGTFHCDEALACFMLKLLPEYKEAEIVRSRDQSILDNCTVVVDVGGKYDPKTHRYDHHMREFKETFDTVINDEKYKSDIKLSSAGLVYCHFGKRILKTIIPDLTDEKVLTVLFNKVYDGFVREMDAVDNGVPMFDGEPKYWISTSLGQRVSRLNPSWNAPGEPNIDELFLKAVALTGEEFLDCVKRTYEHWLPARSLVEEAVSKRFEVDPSGEIIEFVRHCPWKEHLFNIEESEKIEPTIKFAIYQDGSFRIQAVAVSWASFASRIPLPEPWRGKRDEELSQVSGIDGCIFVHANGFIGGNKTRDGAIAMARKTLEMHKLEKLKTNSSL